jgi:hypothetical protein
MNSNHRIRTEEERAAGWLSFPTWLLALLLVLVCGPANAADVVYVQRSGTDPASREQVKNTAEFLGLSVQLEAVASHRDRALLEALHRPELLAVIFSADTLPLLDQKTVFASLKRTSGPIPVMIADINEQSDHDSLRQWSSGAVSGAAKVDLSGKGYWYSLESQNDVTRQLGGSRLPIVGGGYVEHLLLDRGTEELVRLAGEKDSREQPVFVRVGPARRRVFLAAESRVIGPAASPDPYRQQALFAEIAAPMLFLHYAGGDRVWHSPAPYANFTIDDLWLRQPYGHVDFQQLLEHARAHNFHATIAFIPWNYDRSQSSMADLFRKNPDRLSICVHGNDHVHQEFGPLESHPLAKQVENMRQGLARMEKLRALTNVAFDPVMVFPHSIAPVATFSELRRNHYSATVNSLNVPSDASAPEGIDFALRAATLQFGDFPSIRRYSAETDIPRAQLAIDAYLGNPIFLYAHESFFSSGMDAFDKTAALVNTVQPGTQWSGAGFIVQHLYLEKKRFDGKYDLRLFSSNVQIANRHDRDADYVLEKDEDFSLGPKVNVGGNPVSYERSGNTLRTGFRIEKGGATDVSIRYDDEMLAGNIPIAKTSFRTNAIRILSDFRDNVVSRTTLGREFIKSYAADGNAWNRFFLAIAGLGLVICLAWYSVRRRRFIRLSKLNSAAGEAG